MPQDARPPKEGNQPPQHGPGLNPAWAVLTSVPSLVTPQPAHVDAPAPAQAPLAPPDGTIRPPARPTPPMESSTAGEVTPTEGEGEIISEEKGNQLSRGAEKNFTKTVLNEGVREDGTVIADLEAEKLLKKYGVERLKKMIVRRGSGDKMVKLAEGLALQRMDKAQAYTEAGYEATNGAIARQAVRRMLEREPTLRALILGLTQEFLEELDERYGLEKEKVLREIGGVAFSNIDDVATWDEQDVKFVASKDLPRHVKASIKAVKVKYDKNGEISGREIEMYDKMKGLELAAKHLKLLNEEGTTNEIRVIVEQVSSVQMGPED